MPPAALAIAPALVRVPVLNSERNSANPLIQCNSESPYNADRVKNQRPAKGYYTEAEAARTLGLSQPQFRALVRRYILESEDDIANLPMTSFQPSDVAVLAIMLAAIPLEEAAIAI